MLWSAVLQRGICRKGPGVAGIRRPMCRDELGGESMMLSSKAHFSSRKYGFNCTYSSFGSPLSLIRTSAEVVVVMAQGH